MSINRVSNPPSSYMDMSSLNQLREAGVDKDQAKKQEALLKAAKQLESVFMDMVMKSMRQADAVFAEGNMLESQEGSVFRDMLDKQYSMAMTSNSKFGLAESIARQLDPTYAKTHNADAVRPTSSRGTQFSFGDASQFSLLRHPPMLNATQTDKANADSVDLGQGNSATGKLDTSTPTAFVNSIMPYAKRAAAELGIDPRAIVAQAALETGWGKHVMDDSQGKSSLNLFGIKTGDAWQGDKATVQTTEYRQNVAVREVADFRSYNNLDHAFDDYVSFLKNNPRYADALKHSSDGTQWGTHLQKAGYATDPEYGKKIAKLVESDEISGIPKA